MPRADSNVRLLVRPFLKFTDDLRRALWLWIRELPTTVTAQGTLLDNGTPLAVVATLQFASGCLATMDCGFDVENR